MLPRIFELFVQGDRTIDRQSGGLGVGLALVRRLTELHGVLAVEDNADGREMLRTMLEYYGHEVHEAADGAAAVEIAARMRPDVAVVDIGLPGIDGYTVARRLRAAEGGGNMWLIALTGYGSESDRRQAVEAGFDAHLTKPVDPQRLARLLGSADERR
jgi:two-component system, sensor histidine kinase